jgi:short-subunit dehydrogenase
MKTTVLITGASSGIGRATAHHFVRQGAQVAGLARRQERLQALEAEINATRPGHFLPLQADVQDAGSLAQAVAQTTAQFGPISVLVVNAGVGHRGAVVESDWEDIQALLRTNIDGVLHSVRAVVPHMRPGGHIIMVSSVTYNLVAPYAAIYAASKAFVSSLAHSLRLELSPQNIHVTDLLLGRVETEFNANRLGKSGRGGSFPPPMPVEQVAQSIVNLVEKRRRSVALRWIDRLLMLGNLLLPDFIGRRALKQYR